MEADQRCRRRSGGGGGGGGRLRCRLATSFAYHGRTGNAAGGTGADVEQISGGRGRGHGGGILGGSTTTLLSIILFLCYMPLPGIVND